MRPRIDYFIVQLSSRLRLVVYLSTREIITKRVGVTVVTVIRSSYARYEINKCDDNIDNDEAAKIMRALHEFKTFEISEKYKNYTRKEFAFENVQLSYSSAV